MLLHTIITREDSNTHHNTEPVESNEMEIITNTYNSFIQLLHLVYFDMYTKCDIIDYEDQINDLIDRLDTISNDPNYIQELTEKLNKYIEDNNDTNNY